MPSFQDSELKLQASLGLPLVGNGLDSLLDRLLVTQELHGDDGLKYKTGCNISDLTGSRDSIPSDPGRVRTRKECQLEDCIP